MVFHSKSSPETIHFGKQIGRLLQRGDVVALVGDLGAGKTQLIKGLAEGAGADKENYVSSPSFTLINEYRGRTPFYHIDLYRLSDEQEVWELGLEEYFHGEGITAIEWADRLSSLLPDEFLQIHIHYTGENTRSIEINSVGKRYNKLIKEIEFRVPGFVSET